VNSCYARAARRVTAAGVMLIALTGCARVIGTVRAAVPRDDLRYQIDSLTSLPEFRNAHWGVLVVNPRTGDTLYSRNSGKLFMPASNMKIITSAVALAQLGPDYSYRTTFACGVWRHW
jgi:D-alanyl-D-alanine carboxypeptidase/D-alanyl-D-alanine-endopeptidase (penicillin-binding protein 4)